MSAGVRPRLKRRPRTKLERPGHGCEQCHTKRATPGGLSRWCVEAAVLSASARKDIEILPGLLLKGIPAQILRVWQRAALTNKVGRVVVRLRRNNINEG